MTKHKRARRRSYGRRFVRRHVKGKIPLEMGIAGIAIPFTPAQQGWETPMVDIQQGLWENLMRQMSSGFIGFDTRTGQWNLMGAMNPFDFNTARYSKMLIAAGLIGKVRKKFVPKSSALIKKIPLIGSWFS